MAVMIRLAKQGAKKNPQYLIVAVNKEGKRDGEYLQRLGHYFPKAKTDKEKVKIDAALYETWIKKGAQVTLTVKQVVKAATK